MSGAVALAITGAVLLAVLPPRAETAEDTAQAFAEALIAADGPAAVALVVDPPAAASLAAEALDGAFAVDTAEVVLIEQTSERATFDLTLGLAGDTATARLVLVDDGDRWRVADGMWGVLRVETTRGDAVRVGGARVPAPGEVSLLPGLYPVTADPEDLLDGATEAAVFPGTDQDVAIEAIPTEAARNRLTIIPFRDPAPSRQIALFWRASDARLSGMEALADAIIACAPRMETT